MLRIVSHLFPVLTWGQWCQTHFDTKQTLDYEEVDKESLMHSCQQGEKIKTTG